MSLFYTMPSKHVKSEIRILGLDDSYFKKGKYRDVLVIGTIFRAGKYLEGVLSFNVRTDGSNSTSKIIDAISFALMLPGSGTISNPQPQTEENNINESIEK